MIHGGLFSTNEPSLVHKHTDTQNPPPLNLIIPKLKYRDIYHLIPYTAEIIHRDLRSKDLSLPVNESFENI